MLNDGHISTTCSTIVESWISLSMEAYKVLFCLVFISLHSIAASDDCTTSYCGQSFTEVRFPFRITDKQPENCGYSGFDLRCAFPSMLLINLPGSGEFSVRSIDYHSPAIRIYDSLNCLPARLSTFDLSNSPFSAPYFQNFTILSCPRDAKSLSGYKHIDCLSNSSFSVFATVSKPFITSMTSNETGCVITGHLWVPLDQPHDDGFTSQLDEDITLTWSKPGCAKCERAGDSCGYVNSNTKRTKCFSNLAAPHPSGVFRIIAFALAIPCMTVSVVIACFMCNKDRRNELLNRRTTNNTVTPEDVNPPPNIVGLDQATIESYTKVVLGESKRLPGHEDATCPICLSEYHVKEMVRCIPECRHCFHAECIDEWLKMNGTCPVCRNMPSPVHVESEHI
ncbi:putative chromatin regulator PHD family [Helianthus annuus]|nr:putative chromatin regulator PHD family [Helianthus annuus]